MKTIEYAPEGIPVSDAKAEEWAKNFLTGVSEKIMVSTENFITAARVQVCRGVIPHTEVKFVFDGQELLPDSDGRLEHWPEGFCDYTEKLLGELLQGRVQPKG